MIRRALGFVWLLDSKRAGGGGGVQPTSEWLDFVESFPGFEVNGPKGVGGLPVGNSGFRHLTVFCGGVPPDCRR